MKLLSGLSRGAVAVTAATVLGSTLAVTGAVLSGPARAAAVIDTSSQSAFIRSIAPLAQEGQRAYRVPSSVAIAQAILESGWGKSTLTTRGNAFFGIKCSRVMGPYATGCLNMRTREVFNGTPTFIVDGFRTYDDPVDSFKDHGRFLTVNSRYSAAFNYPDDPKRFIAAVHRAGYATDPTYTAMVVRLMDQFNLYRFDVLPAASASATPSRTASVSPGVSPSESAGETPSPSRTATATASASPSATATVSGIPSPTSSATVTVGATPAPTPSVIRSETASPAPTETALVILPTPTPTPTVAVTAPVPTASMDWSAFGPSVPGVPSSHVPYAIPSLTATPTLVDPPETDLPTPSPTPTAVVTTADLVPTASATPSATTPVATATRSVTVPPSATMTPGTAEPTSETNVSAAVESGPQPMVGDGVVPDPSIEPQPEITEPVDSLSLSPDAGVRTASTLPPGDVTRTFEPEQVRAAKPQDPAKAGAQHPDGTQVGVVGLRRPYERHGGLAKTGW